LIITISLFSRMASATKGDALQLAILDDYAGVAPEYFNDLPLKVSSFPETLDATTDAGLKSLVERLKPFQIISSMRERTILKKPLLEHLPNLKLLLTTGMRNASIDMEAAAKRGVVVSGTRGKPKAGSEMELPPPTHDTTTQQALSLLLSLTSRMPHDHSKLIHPSSKFAWQSGFSIPLYGKTLGVVGLGKLGSNFARLCVQSFALKILAWSSNLTQEKADEAAESQGLPRGTFESVSKEELFQNADIVSIHLVLSDRSRGLVGAKELSLMKRQALLVNTARAGLIDEDALFGCLQSGAIYGAALDVFWKEPLPQDSRWRKEPWGEDGRSLVILSPHMGYVNEATIRRWYEEQAEEIQSWLASGEVKNKIN
jgi:lactate dehydrogenase-like 2-hydroxyacid dehydrogenase